MIPLSSLSLAHRVNILVYGRCLTQNRGERVKVMMSLVPSQETLSGSSRVKKSYRHGLGGGGQGKGVVLGVLGVLVSDLF